MTIERRYSLLQHLHGDTYYTKTELDAGQLDNRYYTETEVDTALSGYLPLTGGTLTGGLTGTTAGFTTITGSGLTLTSTGTQLKLLDSDGADTADFCLLDMNGSFAGVYGYDDSAATYYKAITVSTTTGNVDVGGGGNGYVYVSGDSTGHFQPVSDNFGSVEVTGFEGSSGAYAGYSISGRAVFMHNDSTTTGIYDDVNNQWLFKATHGAEASMYYNGTETFKTQSATADAEGTSVQLQDAAGSWHPAGVLYKPRQSLASSTNYTLSQSLLTRSLYVSATGVSITTPASTDTSLADGAAFEVFNLGSGTISVIAGSGVTLYGVNNGTLTTGSPRTIGGRSHAIIYRILGSIWAVFGGNVS